MSYGFALSAEYEDGFTLVEDEADHSPYDSGRNTFHAILNGRPTDAGHGRMVRFSLVGEEQRYDVDWTTLPADARPIYFRRMTRAYQVDGGWRPAQCESHGFGWQGTVDGQHVQEVTEIPG